MMRPPQASLGFQSKNYEEAKQSPDKIGSDKLLKDEVEEEQTRKRK